MCKSGVDVVGIVCRTPLTGCAIVPSQADVVAAKLVQAFARTFGYTAIDYAELNSSQLEVEGESPATQSP